MHSFAIQGAHTDGHRFIADALDKGASVVLAESLAAEGQDARVVSVPDLKARLEHSQNAFMQIPRSN